MTGLSAQNCEACRPDAPMVTDEEKNTLTRQIPEWSIVTLGDEEQLERRFRFANFAEALSFTNAVGELAEQEDHHPTLITEWGRVTVRWWTHEIGGLHKNDFVLAARTDNAYSN